MVRTHHGDLPTAALHGCSPPPYTSVTGDLNLLQKKWSKSMVHSPDPNEDTLKRRIITVPPSITTTHHDGGLPSLLSYTLTNDDPPLPSMPTQRSRQNLRDRRLFQNNGWTKWEAVQLADKLESKQEMVKADWECWKKKEKKIKQIHGPILFDLDDDNQEQALWVACTRERCNADVLQMAKVMDMLPYSPSPSPSLLGSRTKDSAQRKRRGERRTNTGRTVSPDMGRGEDLIKEVAEDVGCIIINDNNIIDDSNEEAGIESSGFYVPRPDNKYKGSFIAVIRGGGLINSGSLSNIGNEDNTSNNDALGFTTVDDNNKKWHKEEAEDMHVRPYSCISIWKGEAHLIVMIIVEVQGDDLRRFDKYEKRATLWTGEYPPVMNCTFFAVHKALKYGWVSIPYHLMLYTNRVAE
jgi:hypothetical protein